ncbi:MAG: hypothetical protein ACR2KZ_21905, partial [Segetibacter sp.]
MKQQLIDLCKEIEAGGVETNSIIPFRKITTIHFARFVVFNEIADAYGKQVGARFVFTTNYDQPYKKHLQELIAIAGKGLWQLFSFCEDFPDSQQYNENALIQYLQLKTVENQVFYVGVGYRSVLQIRQENELRDEIENYIDQHQAALKNQGVLYTRKKIIEFVHSNPALAWAKKPVSKPSIFWKMGFDCRAIFVAIIFLVLLPVIIPFVIIWLILILFTEMTEKDVKY